LAKAGLLTAVCTAALLAAVPAFAQTNAQSGDTGPRAPASMPAVHDPAAPSGQGNTMSPGMRMGSSEDSQSSGAMDHQSSHRSAMGGRGTGMMGGKRDTSQNAAVDRLNDQSFQAAQSGQTFSGSNAAPGAMPGRSSGGSGGSGDGGGGGGGGSGM
jgi:hypothetical protein